MLGSGQLGRMFAIAARRMGYRVHTLSPDDDTPTGQVADLEVSAAYDDLDAVRAFARRVDVVTFEFENVPADGGRCGGRASRRCGPAGDVLHITQHRAAREDFLADAASRSRRSPRRQSLDELRGRPRARSALPAVLKTAALGYDGKGQHRIAIARRRPTASGALIGAPGGDPRSLRRLRARGFRRRGPRARRRVRALRRRSRTCIATTSSTCRWRPADVPEAHGRARPCEIARARARGPRRVGVLCVEFFVTRDGRLLVNELAPRPHNSGHFTFDACVTSQFEQQLRAVCGLPLGADAGAAGGHGQPARRPVGDGEPDWAAAWRSRREAAPVRQGRPAPGRKMGHLTALGDTVDEAAAKALAARDVLC